MLTSYLKEYQGLKFAWVPVPPPLEKQDYLGDDSWHEQRKAAHTSSLLALGLLAHKIGETELTSSFLQSFKDPKMQERLKEQDYHCLMEGQELCSRSHTERWACACLDVLNPHEASVGVDIEHRSRKIRPELKRYYENPEDLTMELQPIEIWCLKEAAFKALSSFISYNSLKLKNLVLTNIQLISQEDGEIHFKSSKFRGKAGILPEGPETPQGLCTAWARLYN